jgi:hypothetical protein
LERSTQPSAAWRSGVHRAINALPDDDALTLIAIAAGLFIS